IRDLHLNNRKSGKPDLRCAAPSATLRRAKESARSAAHGPRQPVKNNLAARSRGAHQSSAKSMLPKGFMWVLIIVPAGAAVPTCAPLVRVPIKRRRIKPLGLLLASLRACLPSGKWRFARRRQAASPCAGRQPELGWGGRPFGVADLGAASVVR